MVSERMRILTSDQDDGLRDFFSGALLASAGLRSALGPQLDRLRWRLLGRMVVDASEPTAQERAVHDLRQHEIVRAALSAIQPYQADTLRAYYEPCPREAIRGLVRDFPDGLAPLALLLAPVDDAEEQLAGEWLRDQVDRARAQNEYRGKPKNAKAQERLTDLRVECRLALRGAQKEYAVVEREAVRQWWEKRRQPLLRVA